jgi:hypothetical protein
MGYYDSTVHSVSWSHRVNMLNQEQFSLAEFADMHLLLGEYHGNASGAMRWYRERYPNRRVPCANTAHGVDRRLRETGSFHPRGYDVGRPRRVAHEEAVLDTVGDDPRQVTGRMGIPHMSVWRVLRDHGLHPYHMQQVQQLLKTDGSPRVTFFQWLLLKCANNAQFLSSVLFTDEASFTRDGIVNVHIVHMWADGNRHTTRVARHQHQFSINVCFGLLGQCCATFLHSRHTKYC